MKNKKNEMASLPSILPKEYLTSELSNLYSKGLPKGLYLGLKELDSIARLDRGRLLTVTGIPNYGKSEFVDYITTSLNRRYGMKTLYFSPENQPVGLHLAKLVSKFTCKRFSSSDIGNVLIKDATDYITDNFYFCNYQKVFSLDNIIKTFENLYQKEGVDILVLDAYNKIESDMPSGAIETNFISQVLDRLCNLAIKYNVLVILVAHPKKMEREGKYYKCPSAYDINGSANFYNKSDYVMVVHRDFKNENTIIKFDKVKFKNYGAIGQVILKYDMESGNYYYDAQELSWDDEDDCDMTKHLPEPFHFPSSNPLDVVVSHFRNCLDSNPTDICLRDFLISNECKDIAETIRSGKTPEERHDIKNQFRTQIPAITVSGRFSQRDSDHLIESTKLMCIDVDYSDNKDIYDRVPNILKKKPYFLVVAKSITGDGYFGIVKVSSNDFKEHFNAIAKDLKKDGVVIDKSCSDITRLRFGTFDKDMYFNENAITFTSIDNSFVSTSTIENDIKPKFETDVSISMKRLDGWIKRMVDANVSIPDDYHTWLKLGMSCASIGESGRAYFHRLSSSSDKYSEGECDDFFSDLLIRYDEDKNECSLGTAIQIVKNAINNKTFKEDAI